MAPMARWTSGGAADFPCADAPPRDPRARGVVVALRQLNGDDAAVAPCDTARANRRLEEREALCVHDIEPRVPSPEPEIDV